MIIVACPCSQPGNVTQPHASPTKLPNPEHAGALAFFLGLPTTQRDAVYRRNAMNRIRCAAGLYWPAVQQAYWHTSGTVGISGPMAAVQAQAAVIARWAGHHSGTFTMSTYVHADDGDLAAAMTALSAVYGTDVAQP